MRSTDTLADLSTVRRELERLGLAEALRALEAPRPLAFGALTCVAWALLLAGWPCVLAPAWAPPAAAAALVPLGLVLGAVGMRLANNLLHEASHREATRLGRLAQHVLLAAPLLEDLDRYRREHERHHARLGEAGADPDFLASDRTTPLGVYASFLLDRGTWRASVLGGLPRLDARGRARVALVWAVALAALGVLWSAALAASFAAYWLVTRATSFHALRVFTEISDHVGLAPGSVIAYSRTCPRNALSLVLHPYNDNFHAAHHLFPRVPMASLARADELLLRVDAYRGGPRHERYFLGPRSVVRSWCAGTRDVTRATA